MSTQSTTMDHPLFDTVALKTTTTQPQTKSRNEALLQVGDSPVDANIFKNIQTMEQEPTKRPVKRQQEHIKSTIELQEDESKPLKRQDDMKQIKSKKHQDKPCKKHIKPKKELRKENEPVKRLLKSPDAQKHVKSKKSKKEMHVVICIHCDCHKTIVKNTCQG